jgi:hypothetical protein
MTTAISRHTIFNLNLNLTVFKLVRLQRSAFLQSGDTHTTTSTRISSVPMSESTSLQERMPGKVRRVLFCDDGHTVVIGGASVPFLVRLQALLKHNG